MTIEQELQETKELLRASVAKCDEQAAMIRQMQDLLRRYLRGRYGAKTERFLGPVAGQTLITEFASLLLPEDLAAAQVAHGEPAPLPTPAVAAEPASADAKPAPVTAKRQPKRGAAWSAKHPELPVEEIVLQPREFRLLEYLMKHAGQVVTRTMLLENVWDCHFDPQTNVIDVHISRLRSKIDKGFSQPLLHTVRGAGYMIRDGAR